MPPPPWSSERAGRRSSNCPSTSEAGEQSVFSGLDPEQLAMLESVTTAVEGGRVLQTALVSVLITDDGRVLAGAVPASRLVEAAQTGR